MDDSALVLAAREGDKDAFAEIYDRYSDRIYSFLCTAMRNHEDAADMLQETFITAGARIHQLREPERLRPWLYAIARHKALRTLSRGKVRDDLEGVEVADGAPDPSHSASQAELSELIQAAAAGMSPRDRVVLDLHLRQGLEGQELGLALGVGAGHAHVLLSRMRDQVERSMGALLVARLGRKDCSALQTLLANWDGKFTSTLRKRVARHVDNCATCGALRKKVLSPVSLLSALPFLTPPATVRSKVLEEVQLVSFSTALPASDTLGQPQWQKDGFPPPVIQPQRRRWLGTTSKIAAVIVFLAAAIWSVELIATAQSGLTALEAGQIVKKAAIPDTGQPEEVAPSSTDSLTAPPSSTDGPEGIFVQPGGPAPSDKEQDVSAPAPTSGATDSTSLRADPVEPETGDSGRGSPAEDGSTTTTAGSGSGTTRPGGITSSGTGSGGDSSVDRDPPTTTTTRVRSTTTTVPQRAGILPIR